ncbi:hypothetical protein QWY82_03275 [Simiduia curdlanivorans]|uniref:Methylamine utilization protein n=1 Tax=Simiduia curdlanivorans TaxID=1492769 RepID=A0ABV8V0W6_9GAMM|nr:hypothetical protein [Simiduia curdlanivorans]MDN3637823.1 hypothetical protein [Simiduia curdlanivorans]
MHCFVTLRQNWIRHCLFCVAALCGVSYGHVTLAEPSGTLSLQILDARGQPAPNTVVIVPSQAEPAEGRSEAINYSIDQINLEFVPHVSLVPTGKPVYFPNSDKTRHHVYSFSEPNNFELKLYREKDAPPVVFQREGVVELGCNIHDSMKGYIYLSNAPVQAVSDADGRLDLPLNSPLVTNQTLLIWHPLMGAKGAVSYPYDSTGPLRLNFNLPDRGTAKPSSLKERLQQFKKHHD